jgi:predicted methyltransferase
MYSHVIWSPTAAELRQDLDIFIRNKVETVHAMTQVVGRGGNIITTILYTPKKS